MSCDILPKEHIDVMVWAARRYSYRMERHASSYAYHYLDPADPCKVDSFNLNSVDDLTRMGQILTDQNYASVNARYGEATPTPKYLYSAPKSDQWSAEEVLSALGGYEYQACEAPGWAGSKAKWLVDHMRNTLVGYVLDRSQACCDHGYSWVIGPGSNPAIRDMVEDRYHNFVPMEVCMRPGFAERFLSDTTLWARGVQRLDSLNRIGPVGAVETDYDEVAELARGAETLAAEGVIDRAAAKSPFLVETRPTDPAHESQAASYTIVTPNPDEYEGYDVVESIGDVIERGDLKNGVECFSNRDSSVAFVLTGQGYTLVTPFEDAASPTYNVTQQVEARRLTREGAMRLSCLGDSHIEESDLRQRLWDAFHDTAMVEPAPDLVESCREAIRRVPTPAAMLHAGSDFGTSIAAARAAAARSAAPAPQPAAAKHQ